MDGYNVCVFAYGQTGSGKTYTMTGEQTTPGIIPNSIDEVFKLIKDKSSSKCEVIIKAQMIEIYLNKPYDLFAPEAHSKCTVIED